MKSKEITIAGKQVNITYCFGTEITFNQLSGKNLPEVLMNNDRQAKDVTYAILAAAIAYAQARKKESPIEDADIMYEATPEEINVAILELGKLCVEWYAKPDAYTTGKTDEEDEDTPKN